jgi:hypothetical protein
MKKEKEESSWLSMLKMELSLIGPDELIEPESGDGEDDDERDNEHFLGEASMEIKRLWTYFATLEEKATRTLIDAKYARASIDKRESLLKKASEMKAKAEMARSILFLNIRDQYQIWNPNLAVGIRKGWRVVSFKSESNPLLDLLRGHI